MPETITNASLALDDGTRNRLKEYQRKLAELKTRRSPMERYWSDLRELVRPTVNLFSQTGAILKTPEPSLLSYDSTATWAAEQLASALHSSLTSPMDRWFSVSVSADPNEALDPEVMEWTETVSDILYQSFGDPRSSFHQAFHENYLDLGVFGTSVLYEEYKPSGGYLCFQAMPLTECWIDESAQGLVDTVYRRRTYTTRQLLQEFPNAVRNEHVANAAEDKAWEVWHIVHPRTDRVPGDGPKSKPFASVWLCFEIDMIFRESGYDMFPFRVPRWTKLAGDSYGRSPGLTALPDIRMLNAMWKTILRASQKMADPPLMLPDDGFMLPLRTSPNAINYYRLGMAERIEALPVPQRLDVPIEVLRDRQESVLKSFYVDWVLRERKKERQSAFEINDERQEKMLLMAPMIGRLKSELLGPTISHSFYLLERFGHIPDPPHALLDDLPLYVHYVSPAFKAQMSGKMANIERYIQQLVPLGQIDPTVFDGVNMARLSSELAILGDVSRRVLSSPQEIEEKQAARQQQQAAAMQAQTANEASGAIKNVAQARAVDPMATDQMLQLAAGASV